MRAIVRPLALLLAVSASAACGKPGYREQEIPLTPAQPAPPEASRALRPTLRFSVAAVESPRETYAQYSLLFERVGRRLGMDIEFVQRRTYREVNDLLSEGKLDAALVCTGGYLDLVRRGPGAVEVVAVPLTDGKPTYESLVIVPASSHARSVEDLAGKRFAYTDELSFSGRAYVMRLLRDLGHDPDRFFGSTLYTQNHHRSITAVATGLVDGAAVHGGVFAHLQHTDPALARRVRVLHRSPPFGAMPVVAATRLDPALRARLRQVLLELADAPEDAAALRPLDIDRFVVPERGLYDSAARVVEARR
ncbi:phosphonate ABC transporter, periplasmic phosphonate-binding protein [Anaeromyxobacter sp. K]|uniref:substrate-binding domain-containing protein n=1 Tax=Anaeromyxobacter sp. (strain K) TaxID=447217 RepID=UPI00015F9E94|nr:phosphate/phosphite/phosphonate ABC transporter substrate-binding protein [Anaeromyxobacter sp. K]ACG74469.1 phosphonate ABC transporter, periplasmic phosphonate-binding protein [Anaeromyxobacter sp. K]